MATENQIRAACEMAKQRSDLVRSIRKAADRFEDEMGDPTARAVGRIYRAAADLIHSVNFRDFQEIAAAKAPDDDIKPEGA